MSIYDVFRGGVWIRQVAACSLRDAEHQAKCLYGRYVTVRFLYRMR